MRKSRHLDLRLLSLLFALCLATLMLTGFVTFDDEPAEEVAPLDWPAAVEGNLGAVRLITGAELEIEFSAEVLSNVDAQATFTVLVDGQPVEWEFLSYFDFGSYASAPVVNVRLKDALDAGEPRGRKRSTSQMAYLARTEHIKGPEAAARITVTANEVTETAKWVPFYMERADGDMSFNWAYASRLAGTYNDSLINRTGSLTVPTNQDVFSATAKPQYTDEFVVRMVGGGLNTFTGYQEYLNLPMYYAGFKALLVGPSQSVYEVPEYRDLYVHGQTTDTWTRQSIKATDVIGNYNPATGEFKRPFIVGTADDVFQHDSFIDENGLSLPWGSGGTIGAAARPKIDHFYFGEAYFDIFYYLGVEQGSQNWPRTAFNDPDDYRFDLQLAEAYDKAKAAGLWQNTKMMADTGNRQENLKNYYVGGALVYYEMMRESQNFEWSTGPVNTRFEIQDYDYPLFWTLSGLHSQWWWWAGTGNGQGITNNTDAWKIHTPWWWQNQVDEYAPPAPGATVGAPYPPLAIESVTVVDHNRIHVMFNREVKTIAASVLAANYRIYFDGREYTPSSVSHGYSWRGIHLRTNHTVNFLTGASTSNAANRLDNGKPYGEFFCGFTQKDIDERSIAAGGWIANNQATGTNALDFGEFVSVDQAIARGAGTNGKIEVAYIPQTAEANKIRDWSGNELAGGKVEAGFRPWMGNAYRSPLTGMYIYLDSATATEGYYAYKRKGLPSPTVKDVAIAAAHQYEAQFTVNTKVTYPNNAGGAGFDNAFVGNNSNDWNLSPGGGIPSAGLGFTWTGNGNVTYGTVTLRQGPITYDRPGQMTIDGYNQRQGGMMLGAASVRGHHVGLMNTSSFNGNILENLRIEGWGGAKFQSLDTAVVRDFNLLNYRNECLIMHEGGHGIDSALGTYGTHIYNDISTAWAAASAPKNGMRYYSVDGVRAYISTRGEYVSTGSTFFASTMRESFLGINDAVWTPIGNREEWFRYDPYGVEAFKRLTFNGNLGLYYEGKIGDPDYRVLPEDWELLKAQNPQFRHWTSENNLVAWGLTVPYIAANNPYTGQKNPLVKWVSFSNPSLWDIEPYAAPTRTDWRANARFDWETKGAPYNDPGPGKQPTQSRVHPFFVPGGVKRPVRSAEAQLLTKPVTGVISNARVAYSPVIVEFELAGYSGEVNMDNAATSFELMINGQPEHFYFWTFEKITDGLAKVGLRLEWPLEKDQFDKITVKLRPVPLVSATPTAVVEKLNGNKNNLTITVDELYANGMTKTIKKTFSIDNNAAATYDLGSHKVYVDTKGNIQIREIRIVSSNPTGPVYE